MKQSSWVEVVELSPRQQAVRGALIRGIVAMSFIGILAAVGLIVRVLS